VAKGAPISAVVAEAKARLQRGDENGALVALEKARKDAKKANDVEALAALVAAGDELQASFTGRRARTFERLLYAARQNQAFVVRVAGSALDTRKDDEAAGSAVADVHAFDVSTAEPQKDEPQEAAPVMRPDVGAVEDRDTAPAERPDVEAAKARMASKIGGRRELKMLDEYLWHDEIVSRLATGTLHGRGGLLVYTDRRLIFLLHGLMSQRNEDFPLDTINSVSVKAGLVLATITVYSGGAKHEISNVQKDDAKAIVSEVRDRLATRTRVSATGPQPSESQPPPQVQSDVLAQLKQLGELRDAGVLTDEEFAAKKTELLARL
jgi:hypothetical protein